MRQLYSFFTAVQFLTRIPCPNSEFRSEYMVNSLVYYPVVGLILGTILTVAHLGFKVLFPESITAALTTTLYVILTGGLHLDGLIDTVDGLFSNRPKSQVMEIMKDSRVGALGVIAAIIVFIIKYSIFQNLGQNIPLTGLIIVLIANRWGLILLITFFPYVRKEGLGKFFQTKSNKMFFLVSTLIALILVILIEWYIGLLSMGITALFAWLYGKKVTATLGGMTGDTYGAFIELSEIIIFLILTLILFT
jgi:adenosylcobinamide-GDP ribazoletransferase